jgi:hypothetical protein
MLLYSHLVGWCSYTNIQHFQRPCGFQIIYPVYPWGVLWWLGSNKSHKGQHLDCMEDVVKSWFNVCPSILSPRQTCEQVHLDWHNPSIPKYASECTGGQNLNFQNTFDSPCDEIRLELQSRKYLRKSNLNEIKKTLCSTKYIQIKFKEFVVFGNL